MSIYYLKASTGDVYELDCTADIGYTTTGRLTSFTMSDLSSASDHYINDNDSIELTGSISDIKTISGSSSGNQKSTEEFITGLTKLKKSSTPFTVYWGLYSNNAEENPRSKRYALKNCFIEVLDVRQNKTRGHLNGTNSYLVYIALRKGKVANQVDISVGAGNLLESLTTNVDEKKATTVVETNESKKAATKQRWGGLPDDLYRDKSAWARSSRVLLDEAAQSPAN